jgi:hypothetical protein
MADPARTALIESALTRSGTEKHLSVPDTTVLAAPEKGSERFGSDRFGVLACSSMVAIIIDF